MDYNTFLEKLAQLISYYEYEPKDDFYMDVISLVEDNDNDEWDER